MWSVFFAPYKVKDLRPVKDDSKSSLIVSIFIGTPSETINLQKCKKKKLRLFFHSDSSFFGYKENEREELPDIHEQENITGEENLMILK